MALRRLGTRDQAGILLRETRIDEVDHAPVPCLIEAGYHAEVVGRAVEVNCDRRASTHCSMDLFVSSAATTTRAIPAGRSFNAGVETGSSTCPVTTTPSTLLHFADALRCSTGCAASTGAPVGGCSLILRSTGTAQSG